MSALAIERAARVKKAGGMDLPVKAGVKIWKGAAVGINAGYIAPFSTATGLVFAGRASATVDNTAGADGAVTCHVDFMKEKTLYPWIGYSGEFVAADLGELAYGKDDQTATHTSTGASALNIVWRIETVNGVQLVWVEV